MGHNVSKKSSKTTEINSISIRQSLANGDVEIAEHGTLSGNPDSKRTVWRSDLTKGIRKSLKHSGKSKSKSKTLNNGTVDDRVQLTGPAFEEPDVTSSPVLKPGSRTRIPVENNDLGRREDETRKSKKKKNPNRPYRSDSVLAMKPSKDNNNAHHQNGIREREVVEKTVVTKFNDKDSQGQSSSKSPSGDSEVEEEKCSFQRFEKQRSTTRRKSRKANKGRAGADSSGKTLSRIINGDEQATNGHGDGTQGGQGDTQPPDVFVSPTKLYNIINDGGPEALREIDKHHVVLFDTRAMDDYERAHIIGAEQIALSQSDLRVDLSVPYSWIVLYDDDGQSHFASQSVLTATVDRLTYLGHRAKILQGGFDSFVAKYPFMCQTDSTPISNDSPHYPSEIIRNRLYLGCIHQATDPAVVSDLEIVYVLNIGTEVVKPISGHGRVMNLQFRENSKNDLLQVMPQVLSVISSALEEKAAKILVTCSTGNNKSAAVIALYLMHKKKWPMERALRFISSGRQSIELSRGVNQQLERCEKFVFQAY